MKYFDERFKDSEKLFTSVFQSITEINEMEIFIYEYRQWLRDTRPTHSENRIERTIIRSICYHMGWCHYGATGSNTMTLLTNWTNALWSIIDGKVPQTPIENQRRHLELLMGD